MILMETGQENAETLVDFLSEISHPALGVNFDPANMILYGKGDPVQGLEILAPWVKHVHIIDALRSPISGEWGSEVPWGEGDFDNNEFCSFYFDISKIYQDLIGHWLLRNQQLPYNDHKINHILIFLNFFIEELNFFLKKSKISKKIVIELTKFNLLRTTPYIKNLNIIEFTLNKILSLK